MRVAIFRSRYEMEMELFPKAECDRHNGNGVHQLGFWGG
jgi:hypothetical protein